MQNALKASGVDYPLAMSMNAEEKAATGLMWTAFQMDGVVWNDDGTFNKDAIMDALNYYQEVLDADLVAPEDKTAFWYGGLYENLQWYSKFSCRTNNVCI